MLDGWMRGTLVYTNSLSSRMAWRLFHAILLDS